MKILIHTLKKLEQLQVGKTHIYTETYRSQIVRRQRQKLVNFNIDKQNLSFLILSREYSLSRRKLEKKPPELQRPNALHKMSIVDVIEVIEGMRRSMVPKKTFKKIMTENLPSMIKDINLQLNEFQTE